MREESNHNCMRFSDFSGAKFNNAELTGAKLKDSNFKFSDLRSANLRCEGLETCNLENAILVKIRFGIQISIWINTVLS